MPEDIKPILPPRSMKRDFLLSRLDFFVTVQLWPAGTYLRPREWLENFPEDEMDHAIHLLTGFMYFSSPVVNRILAAAFQALSTHLDHGLASFAERQAAWTEVKEHLYVTYPTGERPNPTDSGYTFARKARQVLGFDENRILHPQDAVKVLAADTRARILFVDDFVGTGNQFLETWARTNEDGKGGASTLSQVCDWYGRAMYSPVVATSAGVDRIRTDAPLVALSPGHVLDDRYGAFAPDSYLWPPHLIDTAAEFIESASQRAGIPDFDGLYPNDWRGFGKLGLALAIETSVPDATLPLFYWQQGDWVPLLQRR